MKDPNNKQIQIRKNTHRYDGSVLIVTLGIIAILFAMVAVTLHSTANKYLTAYQWASWQEALQGAETGADIAMNELRKDITNDSTKVAWVGWRLGKYVTVNGKTMKDPDPNHYDTITGDGTWPNNQGNGGGNSTVFRIVQPDGSSSFAAYGYDFMTYTTNLSPHAGEGNTTLKITTTIDGPASLKVNGSPQWVRVRATGTTNVTGGQRVSEEKLDNRLRKLGLFFDKVMNGSVGSKPVATRQIELVAKPVSLFSGALSAMVQLRNEGHYMITDSFSSEDPTNFPYNSTTGEFDLTKSHDPTASIGKNGDIGSNAFPIKHDKSENLTLDGSSEIWGDIGNNYSQIKGISPLYYNTNYDPTNPTYGLNNGGYYTTNPNTKLIKTDGDTYASGNIETDYFRDMPPVLKPNWNSGAANAPTADLTLAKVDKGTADVDLKNYTDPTHPYRIRVGTFGANGVITTRAGLTLAASDKWVLKSAPKPGGWNVNTPPIHSYVEIWITGDIKLDDGGTVVIQQQIDGGSQKVISDVTATIYFDRNIKIGETKETKTNAGGFDNQADDSKNLILLGVTEPDGAQKLPHDSYIDPLGNESVYTPYKATGNVVFKENDFAGAIYAPDHNFVFSNTKDGKGKRHKRKQTGNDFYGAYVGRTINNKSQHNFHFDESLNDAGPVKDWGYVSWFEDVDVNNR